MVVTINKSLVVTHYIWRKAHFIPWSFVKDDKIWNFVLACPSCNSKKNNRIPTRDYIVKIENRNDIIKTSNEALIETEMKTYSNDVIERMWNYARLSGMKEYIT